MLLRPKNYAFTTYYISDSYTSTFICFTKTEISNTFCFLRCLGFVKKSINKNTQIYFSIFFLFFSIDIFHFPTAVWTEGHYLHLRKNYLLRIVNYELFYYLCTIKTKTRHKNDQ